MNICLCFNEQKGLHTQNCTESKDAIFTPYNFKGYKTTIIEVPVENLKITIESNFKFGSRSFLYALIERNGLPLLDFSTEKITVLNNSSINRFSVASEDWTSLLEKIVIACNTLVPGICPISSIGYVEKLCQILKSDSVEIKGSFQDEKLVKWDGKFLVTLLVGDKLRDLIDGLKHANMDDEILSAHIIEACQQFLNNIHFLSFASTDKRSIRFAQTLHYVCDYMMTHGAEMEFLRFFRTLAPKA